MIFEVCYIFSHVHQHIFILYMCFTKAIRYFGWQIFINFGNICQLHFPSYVFTFFSIPLLAFILYSKRSSNNLSRCRMMLHVSSCLGRYYICSCNTKSFVDGMAHII